jgi:hypothetical protein
LRVWDVHLHATFYKTEEELKKARSDGEYGFKKLILLGAKWDFEQQMLVEKNEMHEYETRQTHALITPRHDASTDLIKCPFYVNCDRSSKNKTSSFLCYIPMVSTIPEDLVFKKSIMLAIDDS